MYLTRDEAIAELVKGDSTEEAANALLDSALCLYPRSARTNFDLITGYAAGKLPEACYPSGPVDLFTISPW
jgi:hypothetical protein